MEGVLKMINILCCLACFIIGIVVGFCLACIGDDDYDE